MKFIEFVKIVLKHKVVLVLVPLLFGALGVVLTSNQEKTFYSQTVLYTGIASGSSIEMNKKFNYLAANNAFDNLINIVKSRDTQEEVAIRLLAQHLMLDGPKSTLISKEAYEELQEILPKEIKSYVVSTKNQQQKSPTERQSDYEATVLNLKKLMHTDNSNFVYSLLNFDNPYYSLEAISQVKAERMSSSDLIKLSYETDDPGICQQTLQIYTDVCISKYKDIKENGSDAVVKYFEAQLKQSEKKLKAIEQRLLKFNQDNNIINYYEQSKAVAIVKEDMNVAYRNNMAQLAGSKASAKRLAEKLQAQEIIQQKNAAIVSDKKQLGKLKFTIGMYEAKSSKDSSTVSALRTFRKQAKALEDQIAKKVNELYSLQNSKEGVPLSKTLPDWVDKIVNTEDLQAKLKVMNQQNKKLQAEFAKYAPAGAHLKRIEREIEVAEQEYLEILHGLNLAKLKFQDTQLSSNLKAVDAPYFPLKPNPSKRKLIVIAIVFVSGGLILFAILLMMFFDETLKNQEIATAKIGVPALGMLPKITMNSNEIDQDKIVDRLKDSLVQNVRQITDKVAATKRPKIIVVFSTQQNEGKTVVAGNLARQLKEEGVSVRLLHHEHSIQGKQSKASYPWLYKLLGYPDPRIDQHHYFLQNPTDFLTEEEFSPCQTTAQMHQLIGSSKAVLDCIIIELPSVLEHGFQSAIMAQSDLSILVSRANRLWSDADKNAMEKIKEVVGDKLRFVINGVQVEQVESVIGELPKKRTQSRRKLKRVLQFQFFTNHSI